ncbi:hypothetical protein [Acetobacter thailandicus]|uniref:hypothetical protein n=1 Tax=Acetobacter thailandicus TaxID=1502842 RepID=UPI001BA84FEF|nr:hypothetical protein [Acetobacter thailandicus]MBS0961361.1 hypothetical protein [Acetobacter thailandicus]
MPFFDKIKENEMKRAFACNMHCELDEWIENLVKEGKQSKSEAKKNAWRLAKNFEQRDTRKEIERLAKIADQYGKIVDSQKYLKK